MEPPAGDGSDQAWIKDKTVHESEMARYIRDRKIDKVVIVGLATDYW
jgi:hypothetical protein